MTTNLPASIESASAAVIHLGDDVGLAMDTLSAAFGLPFTTVAYSMERDGSLPHALDYVAHNLDALAKTAEAASCKLRGRTVPVREIARPYTPAAEAPCQCVPAAETLTVPMEAGDEDETDDIEAHPITANHIEANHIEEHPSAQKTTVVVIADDPGESVIRRPDFPAGDKSNNTHEGAAVPEIEGTAQRRQRNRGKAKRK